MDERFGRRGGDDSVAGLGLSARDAGKGRKAGMARPVYELVPTPGVLIDSRRGDPQVESFRRLRAEVFEKRSSPPQVVMVTSPLPSEGKSIVSLNLALSRSRQQPGSVLLIDADLRGVVPPRWIRPQPAKGLSHVLRGTTTIDECLVELRDPRLSVLPAGETPSDSFGAVHIPDLERIFRELRDRFETIIIDTPPVELFADAMVLAAVTDAILVVVRARSTPQEAFESTMESLSGFPLLGVILNDAQRSFVDRSAKYHGYYHYYQKDRKTE